MAKPLDLELFTKIIVNLDEMDELHRKQAKTMQDLRLALTGKAQRQLDGIGDDERLKYVHVDSYFHARRLKDRTKGKAWHETLVVEGRTVYVGFLIMSLERADR